MDPKEKNLLLLDKRFGTLYQRLQKNLPKDELIIKVHETQTESPTLVASNDYDSFVLHSKYDPIHEASTKVNKFLEEKKGSFIFAFGMGLGYALSILVRNLSKNDHLVVFEPSWKIFDKALELESLSSLLHFPNLDLIVGSNMDEVSLSIKKSIFLKRVSSFEYFNLTSEESLFPEVFQKVKDCIHSEIKNLRDVYQVFGDEAEMLKEEINLESRITIQSLCLRILRKIKEGRGHTDLELLLLQYYKLMGLKKLSTEGPET